MIKTQSVLSVQGKKQKNSPKANGRRGAWRWTTTQSQSAEWVPIGKHPRAQKVVSQKQLPTHGRSSLLESSLQLKPTCVPRYFLWIRPVYHGNRQRGSTVQRVALFGVTFEVFVRDKGNMNLIKLQFLKLPSTQWRRARRTRFHEVHHFCYLAPFGHSIIILTITVWW